MVKKTHPGSWQRKSYVHWWQTSDSMPNSLWQVNYLPQNTKYKQGGNHLLIFFLQTNKPFNLFTSWLIQFHFHTVKMSCKVKFLCQPLFQSHEVWFIKWKITRSIVSHDDGSHDECYDGWHYRSTLSTLMSFYPMIS